MSLKSLSRLQLNRMVLWAISTWPHKVSVLGPPVFRQVPYTSMAAMRLATNTLLRMRQVPLRRPICTPKLAPLMNALF